MVNTSSTTPPGSNRIGQPTATSALVAPIYTFTGTTPNNPYVGFNGQLAIDGGRHSLQYYNGTLNAWQGVTAAPDVRTYYQAIAPTGSQLQDGDQWYCITTGLWFHWNSTVSNWVPGQSANTPEAPNNPVQGQAWFNNTASVLRYWNGTAWVAATDVTAPVVTYGAMPSAAKLGDRWVDVYGTNWNCSVAYASAGTGANWSQITQTISHVAQGGSVAVTSLTLDPSNGLRGFDANGNIAVAIDMTGALTATNANIAGTVNIGSPGSGQILIDNNGLHGFNTANQLVFDVNNGTGNYYFNGNADIGTLTVETAAQFMGPTLVQSSFEYTNGASIQIDGTTQISMGSTRPSVTVDWLQLSSVSGKSLQWIPSGYATGASNQWVVATQNSGGGTLYVVNPNGGLAGVWTGAGNPATSVTTVYGGGIANTAAGGGPYGYVVGYDGTNTSIFDVTHGYHWYISNNTVAACTDTTYIWTLVQTGTGTPVLHSYWPDDNGAASGSNNTALTTQGLDYWPSNCVVTGMGVSSAASPATDISGSQLIYVSAKNISTGALTVLVFSLSAHHQTNQDWIAPNNTGAIAYGTPDGTTSQFWGLRGTYLVKFEGGTHHFTTSSGQATWYAGYTWYQSTGPTETMLSSPVTSFTMNQRARVTISASPAIPSGANNVRVYASSSGSAPASMHLQATQSSPAVLVLGATAYNVDTQYNNGGATAPTSNSFGAGSYAQLVANGVPGSSTTYIRGDGTWLFGTMSGTASGAPTFSAGLGVSGGSVTISSGSGAFTNSTGNTNQFNGPLTLHGAGATFTQDSASANGFVSAGINNTNITSGTANVVVHTSNAIVGWVSSSLKYKTNVQDLDHAGRPSLIDSLRPVSYEDKYHHEQFEAGDPDWQHDFETNYGFIAEEVEALGWRELVAHHALTGDIMSIHYDRIIAPLILELRTRFTAIENRLTVLENR